MRCPDVFSQRGRGYGHALSPLLLLHLTFTANLAAAGLFRSMVIYGWPPTKWLM